MCSVCIYLFNARHSQWHMAGTVTNCLELNVGIWLPLDMSNTTTSSWKCWDWSLRWRHNECDGVSNQQLHDCLLNRLFRRRSKHQSSVSLAFVRGIHRWAVNSPHKGPVTWNMFHLMTSSCVEYTCLWVGDTWQISENFVSHSTIPMLIVLLQTTQDSGFRNVYPINSHGYTI